MVAELGELDLQLQPTAHQILSWGGADEEQDCRSKFCGN